jgi:uncharacterized protein (TIGR02265 family)
MDAVSPPRERLVYDVTVESMFCRALKHRLTTRLKARVKEAGIDVDARLEPSYSREVWLRAMSIVVEELYPGVPEERAWFELGERLVVSLGETLMGPAIAGVIRLLGPKRALGRLGQNFQYANNYNQSKLEEVGPGQFRLWVNEVGVSPHFIAGSVSAILRISGATTPRVEIVEFDGQQCTYAIST